MSVSNTRIRSFNIFFLPLILFCASYLVFGFYYGTSDDATIEALLRGFFFDHPVTEFFAFHRITAIFYARLYEAFPEVPWYGAVMYVLLLIAVTNCFILIHRNCEKWLGHHDLLTAALIIVYSILLLDTVILFTFTKLSILLATSSILLLMSVLVETDRLWPNFGKIGLLFALFILAFLTRPEAGLLSIFLTFSFALFYPPVRRTPLRFGSLLIALLVVVGSLKLYDRATATEASRYYQAVLPYIFNTYDDWRDRDNLAVNYSAQDSLKYQAIASGAFDRDILNVQFLSGISTDQTIHLERLWPSQVVRAIQKMAREVSPYYWLAAFLIGTLNLTLVFLLRRELRLIIAASFAGFNLFYWGTVLAVASFWRMPDRVLSPVVIAYILCALLFLNSFRDDLPNYLSTRLSALAATFNLHLCVWVTAMLVLAFAAYRKLPGTQAMARSIQQNSWLMQRIDREGASTIVAFTFNGSQGFLSQRPIVSLNRLPESSRYLLINGSWPILLPGYTRHLTQVTGSDRTVDVLDFLIKNRDKVIFVSTPNQNTFLQAYSAAVYKKYLTFDALEPQAAGPARAGLQGTGSEVGLYRIRRRTLPSL